MRDEALAKMHAGCGRTLVDPNSETIYSCGTVGPDVCDDCIEAYLQAIGFYDDDDDAADPARTERSK